MREESPKIISRILVVIVCIMSAILISLIDIKTTINSLTIELMSDQVKSFRLYYDTGNGYNEQESVDGRVVRRGKQVATFHFQIPNDKTLTAIRIDPDEQPTQYFIKTISLNYLDYFERIYPHLSWDAEKIEKLFVPLHNVKPFVLQQGHLLVETDGPDPYFGTKKNLSEMWKRLRNEQHPLTLPLKIGSYLFLAVVAILFFFYQYVSTWLKKISSVVRKHIVRQDNALSHEHLLPKAGIFGPIPLIIIAGVCASILMYWITDQGPGVSPDSTAYIGVARSLLAGNGFFFHDKAMTHYPPGYPLLIAGVAWLYLGDILQATRFLAALLFGANFVLLGLAVHMCTRRSLAATGCVMLIFLFSAPTILIHSMAWTEAPFITFCMVSFLLLSHYIMHPRPYVLVLAGLVAGFAVATRYVGVVLFPTVALAFFVLDKRSIKPKTRDMAIFAGVASLPLASWIIRNILIAQSATNRTFAFHPVGLGHVKRLIIAMHDFILPISISPWIKEIHFGVAVALFCWGFAIIFRKIHSKQNAMSMGIVLSVLCFMFSVIYIVFLFISISFFDALTPLDDRILFPAILALIIAGITLAWSLSEASTRRWIWHGFVVLASFSVIINAIPAAIAKSVHIHNYGSGYTSQYWDHSKTIAYLADSLDVRTIYTNGADVIGFLTEKKVVFVPPKIFPGTRKVNEDYEKKLNQIISECREGKVLIVYINGVTCRGYFPSIEEVESTGNLPVLSRMQDGVIYGTR